MRSPAQMGIIQIDITNACHSRCSNCTRLIGHHRKDQIFFMSLECFKKAVDSLEGFPEIVGIIGGDPLLHPQFGEIIAYLEQKVKDPTKRGLWSSVPAAYFKHFEAIQRIFPKWQFLNDRGPESGRPHIKSIPSIHQPMLVAIQDVVKDKAEMWRLIDKCWVQEMWSATLTPKGAYVCEVMGAFDQLYDGNNALPMEPGWWKIQPGDEAFQKQVKHFCPGCGACLPTERRKSSDMVDDISTTHYEKLKGQSPKLKKGLFVQFDEAAWDPTKQEWHPNAQWYLDGGSADRLTDENKAKIAEAQRKIGLDASGLRETSGL